MKLDYNTLEAKWKQIWEANQLYKVTEDTSRPKFYVLDMFPYPSGAGLHVGHPLGYVASDIYSRYKRMKGFNVLHPMGYDALVFLPNNTHSIRFIRKEHFRQYPRYREQLDNIGFSFDWSRQVRMMIHLIIDGRNDLLQLYCPLLR